MSKIYPIGGGKGGIGKSFTTANLGALLAKKGYKVVLVDLDLGGSNLHTFFGLKGLKVGINNFLNKTIDKLDQAAVPTGVPNLSVITSTNCSIEIANLFNTQKRKIINGIRKLPYDYILMDLGAGTNFNTLDFFLTSNEGVFICTTEPTSVENSFRFIKAIYLRKLKQILKQPAFNSILKKVKENSNDVVESEDIIKTIAQHDPEKEQELQSRLSEFKFKFILNQFRKHNDVMLGGKIEKVCNRHFLSKFQFLGSVDYDSRVHDSIFSKKLFVDKYPYTAAAVDLHNISKLICGEIEEGIPLSSKVL
jgi:flagellar biosynthesis protein FlhG